MKYIRYTAPNAVPIAGMRRWLQDAFDTFDEFGPRLENAFRASTSAVAADLYENDDAFNAVFELPGFAKEDIQVSLENSVLTVQAEANDRAEDDDLAHTASRSVAVPDNIDSGKVTAKLENGVLTVTLAKAESAKARTVVVE
ncbi:MAG: Hsp20/alpha crystallin family protein [Verrucomicrobiota bacterium]